MNGLSTVTDRIAEGTEQCKALLETSTWVYKTNVNLCQMLRDIQRFTTSIPGQIQRQQPVYLIDAFNKESPFHLEFIRSSDALLAVHKANFQTSGCDTKMIDQGQFVIEEVGTETAVDLSQQ